MRDTFLPAKLFVLTAMLTGCVGHLRTGPDAEADGGLHDSGPDALNHEDAAGEQDGLGHDRDGDIGTDADSVADGDAQDRDATSDGDIFADGDSCGPEGCWDGGGGDDADIEPDAEEHQCADGYEIRQGSCVDINECQDDPCGANFTCRNTPGGFTCTEDEPVDCTTWDNSANAPCAPGTYNCDCFGHCGATTPCGSGDGGSGTWPPPDAVEIARYHGLTNGGRPTFYFSQTMSSYPANFTIEVVGCARVNVVGNNGHRFEGGGLVIKQSEVAGRGMAVVALSSCSSDRCYVTY